MWWLVIAGIFLFYAFGRFFQFKNLGQWTKRRRNGFLACINCVLICVATFLFDKQSGIESNILYFFCAILFWVNMCFIPCGVKFINRKIPLIIRNTFFLCWAIRYTIVFVGLLKIYFK